MAFLSLDNLSGDPSLSWMSEAVPTAAAAQLAGVDRVLPLRADTSRDAATLGATQLIHGHFSVYKNQIRFEFLVEDATTHRMRPVRQEGRALEAAGAIAKAISPEAKPFSTQNPAAMEAWGRKEFEKATQLDPDFGAAWRDLVQSSQPQYSLVLAENALSRSSLRGPVERAQIGLLSAQLRRDSSAISKASAELGQLLPNDVDLAKRLAEAESNGREFASAVGFYRTVLRLEPENTAIYNQLGYAQFFAGDLAGARKSFDKYSETPAFQPNALDSQGEVLFMAGQFGEAETYFQLAHKANPEMVQGGDLLKAAYARWLAGNLKAADAIFTDYIRYRSDHNDQTVGWRRATWEFATGRPVEAIDRLKKESGPTAAMAQAQLQVFNNPGKVIQGLTMDLAALEQSYRRTAPGSDGLVRVLYAKGLMDAGRKAEAERLLLWWPLPEAGDPVLQPLQYPLYLELKENIGK